MPKTVVPTVVFIPLGPDHLVWLGQSANYCAAKSYEIVAVVSNWMDVLRYLIDGRAEVAVTPRRAFIPGDAIPRVEVIEEQPTPQPQPRWRRPKLLR